MPLSAAFRWNWIEISGRATPVMNTTMPSKNLPAQASAQIRNCMAVIGIDFNAVPSGHGGQLVDVFLHRLSVDLRCL